jgi:hypothetical protein
VNACPCLDVLEFPLQLRRNYFRNVEHVFDYYWVSRAVENGSSIVPYFFHNSLRDPHHQGEEVMRNFTLGDLVITPYDPGHDPKTAITGGSKGGHDEGHEKCNDLSVTTTSPLRVCTAELS